jgi:hypothetical protein
MKLTRLGRRFAWGTVNPLSLRSLVRTRLGLQLMPTVRWRPSLEPSNFGGAPLEDEKPPVLRKPADLLAELSANCEALSRELSALEAPPPAALADLARMRAALADARGRLASGAPAEETPTFFYGTGPHGKLIGLSLPNRPPIDRGDQSS